MSFSITKRFRFSGSHVLAGLPEGHKCGRLHGHNWTVILECAAQGLDSVGFVIDYGALKGFSTFIDRTLDHRHLNDVMVDNPTAEHLAAWLFTVAKDFGYPVSAVTVCETENTTATYRP